MKVLVISLLRLGDVLMQKPLLDKLAQEGHQVHLLINLQFEGVKDLLGDTVTKVHLFDRESYQRAAGEAQFNILYGIHKIDQLIDELNRENFDQIINFTHNRLSSILAGSVSATERKGCHYLNGQYVGIDNPWDKYFNTHFSTVRGSIFHYTEVLAKMFSIPVARYQRNKRADRSGLVLLQCFTSDSKKNWSLEGFAILKKAIEDRYPFHIVRVLAAPSEVAELSQHFKTEDIWEADLGTAAHLLKEANLFIGLDTSIKHLAAIAGTPIVEINLGGADHLKTGAFSDVSLQWSSDVPCSPCSHSISCPQKSHLCADQLEIASLMRLVDRHLNRKEISADVDIEADKIVWEMYLDGQLPQRSFQPSPTYMARTLKLLEWQLRLEKALTNCSGLYLKTQIDKNDVVDFILLAQEILKSKQDKGSYFLALTDALIHTPPQGAQMYKALEMAVAESRNLLKIRSDLTLGVKNEQINGRDAEASLG